MTKDRDFYLSLPYTKTLRRDEAGDIVASVSEFPGCIAHGSTEAEALEFLGEVMAAWIEMRIEGGLDVPMPHEIEDLPSGKWVQRVSRSLHRALADIAKEEDVSLNQFVSTVLAEAVGRRRAVPLVRVETGPSHVSHFDALETISGEAFYPFLTGHTDCERPWQVIDAAKPFTDFSFFTKSMPKRGEVILPQKKAETVYD